MRLVNFQYYKTKYIFTTLLLLTTYIAFGQKKIPINWNAFRPEVGDHWVTTLHHSPEFYSSNTLILNDDTKTKMQRLSALTIGTTFLQSSPKRTFTYGFGANYNYSLIDINAFNASYRYDIQSAGTSFFMGYQKPNIIGRNHPFVHLGLTQRFVISSKLTVFDTQLSNYSSDIGVNKFPMFGYLEMGLQQDEFLITNPRNRVKNLSVSMDFPFFNLSNFFTNNRKNYNTSTIGFFNSSNPQAVFRLNYQQYLDVKGKREFEPEVNDIANTKGHLFLPPLISMENPEHSLFGRIFVDFLFSSSKDSINVSAKNASPQIIPNAIFNQIGIGYTIHWGNYYPWSDGNNTKNFHYDLFGSVSIFKTAITNASINLYKYESIGLKTEAGIRIGTKKGWYLVGGGGFQFLEFSKKYTRNATILENDIQSPYKNKFSYFGGVAFKNLILLKLTHIDTEIIRQKPVTYWDSIYYSIAIGF